MRRAVLITIAAGIARLVVGALTPLFPDETYYWEWSRRLAAGYFDHPPMIAWLIRGGTMLAGDTPLGVRLLPVIAGTLAALFASAAARQLAGDRAATLTAIVFAVMPLSAAGLILATPDAALLAAAAAMTYAVIRAVAAPLRSRESLSWWSLGGVALGLGLCSKYTAVLLPAGVLAAVLLRPALRVRLREPGPYVATVIALLLFSPVVVWNARHEWISFAFQLKHGLGAVGGSILRRELDLVGGQLGLVTPILFVMMVIAVARSFRSASPPSSPPAASLLGPMFVFVFVFFAYSATKRRVEANWPALSYVPGVLLLALQPVTRRWEQWLRAGIVLAGLVTAATYVNSFTPILPVPARRDPVARSAGWVDLARAVDRVYAPRRPVSSYRTHIAADRYQEASQLAFHVPDAFDTYALNLTTRANQYDLWPSFAERAHTGDALILVVDEVAGDHPTVVLLTPHFERVTRGEQVVLARDGDPVKYLRIWILDRWRGTWPGGGLRSSP